MQDDILSDFIIQPFEQNLEDFAKLESIIEKSIDLDKARNENEYVVNPRFSSKLQELSKQINKVVKDIEDQREALNRRLVDVEKRIRAQFTALDSMIAGMTQTSNFLQQQLSRLPNTSK